MIQVVRAWRRSRKIRLLVLIGLLGSAAGSVLSQERRGLPDAARRTEIVGSERLVSVEPLPVINGQMCELPTAQTPIELASLQRPATQSRTGAAANTAAGNLINRQ